MTSRIIHLRRLWIIIIVSSKLYFGIAYSVFLFVSAAFVIIYAYFDSFFLRFLLCFLSHLMQQGIRVVFWDRRYEGNSHVTPLNIVVVLIPKEPYQRSFFVGDSLRKEFPPGDRKQQSRHRIVQDHLRPDGPIIKSRIRWVAKIPIDSVRDQDMVVLSQSLNIVVKRFSALYHGVGPNGLRENHHSNANRCCQIPPKTARSLSTIASKTESYQKLRAGNDSRYRVGFGMVDQKRIACHDLWIEKGRDKKFHEVEGAHGSNVKAPIPGHTQTNWT